MKIDDHSFITTFNGTDVSVVLLYREYKKKLFRRYNFFHWLLFQLDTFARDSAAVTYWVPVQYE